MGLFKRKNKTNKEKQDQKILQQDLSEKDWRSRPGGLFMVQLLMREPCAMPDKEQMVSVMEKHLGEIEYLEDENAEKNKVCTLAAKSHMVKYEGGEVTPPFVMITSCEKFDESTIDAMQRSQFWEHKDDYEEILSRCPYSVVANDMMAGNLPPNERANFDMDFVEALIELYPQCEAVYFMNSGTLFLAEEINNHSIPRKDRFVYFAVNVRFFSIQGSTDKLIDTLGMSTLRLPDLQYHFNPKPASEAMEMEPDWVVFHARNMAQYIVDNDKHEKLEDFLFKDGDTIDGIRDGKIVQDIFWKCFYEDSLIQPSRLVLDICMNAYAAGERK